MKSYDYLIVGAGLFGAVFAHEAKKPIKNALSLISAAILAETFIPQRWKAFRCMNMALIFFTLPIKKSGSM